MTPFDSLGLAEPILDALHDVGYENPSPIQEQAIPELLAGRDVIGQAQTGTGKTAAFGLPMIQFVDPSDDEVQALVLTPTRELCIQVTQALRAYGARKGIQPVAVFGGAPIRTQQAQLKEGGQIVVGTVGRVLDLISRHSLLLHSLPLRGARRGRRDARPRLPRGRREDPLAVPGRPPDRAVQRDDAAGDPRARRPPPLRPRDGRGQGGDADHRHRRAVLRRGRRAREERHARQGARGREARPGDRLRAHEDPLRPALPHAARPRDERQGAARRHVPGLARRRDAVVQERPPADPRRHRRRRPRPRHLVVTHVVNFDVPTSPDVYVHRIGRTGRVGRSGRAIMFVEPRQKRELAGDREERQHVDRPVVGGRQGRAGAAPSSARAATPSRTTPSVPPPTATAPTRS